MAEPTPARSADKASKTRELRIRLARGRRFERADRGKIDHYEASLEMLRRQISGHPLVDQLATELDALHAVRGGDRSYSTEGRLDAPA